MTKMIMTKTPFRISFAGGGSDISNFYQEYGGCVLSSSINKYMYILTHPYFDKGKISLKYSETELVDDVEEIRHKIFNCVLRKKNITGIEITSIADIPGGTGLGSSSTFTVGLLNTLSCYSGKFRSKDNLAEEACEIEIDKLREPIGKQDQYAAAFGGFNFIRFNRDNSVQVEPIVMKTETYSTLEQNLLMFYTGMSRSASSILTEQKKNISDISKVENLKKMCLLAEEMKTSLEDNDLSSFGQFLNEGWLLKKELAKGISSTSIDELYNKAISEGALGGKLLGAGGGGFLLFYVEPEYQERVRIALSLRELKFNFERDGTSVAFIGDKYWDL